MTPPTAADPLLELMFAQSLDGIFFMMLDEPVPWGGDADTAAQLDYIFAHQRVTRANEAMRAQYGGELVGLTPADVWSHDLAEGRRVWKEFFDQGRLHVETNERRLDGTPIIVEGDYICLYDDEGRITGHFGIQRDVTERKTSEAALRELAARLQTIREEERTRIAREIHDELGQALTGLKMDLAWMRTHLAPRQPAVHERLLSVLARVDATTDAVRRIASELRPSVLDHLGLVAAVEWLAQDFERRSGVPTSLHVQAAQVRLDDTRATTAFRIVQEALTNVARHARASRVDIRLAITSTALDLEVADDGRGISPAETSSPEALGLLGLRERARACGGTADIGGNGARGTKVSVRLPLGAAAG